MSKFQNRENGQSFVNPVYPDACPDPYVLKYLNEYWCYCTGLWPDGRYFGVLHSRDLLNWRPVGGAMEPLNEQATCYWAPEVIYENGHFLMYYSVGNEATMQIRLAIAEHPAGPFVDAGRGLTSEEFAIDPHVFKDEDGTAYLFYATDFLQHTHIGTGTVCDRMLDPLTLAGAPRPVTRARYDWQVYDPERLEKGGVRWHTVEGPFVLKRKGIYYQMFSGGNWQNQSYGVSYALSERIVSAEEWQQVADGEKVLPILRTTPQVIGPGHNSAVRGTDNLQMYCVYHRWAEGGHDRVLAIDPMDWAGQRMLVLGPTTTPQPAPNPPTFADYFEPGPSPELGERWQCDGGIWTVHEGAALQVSTSAVAEARYLSRTGSFIAEVSMRLLQASKGNCEFGIRLGDETGSLLSFTLSPTDHQAIVTRQSGEGASPQKEERRFNLPKDFRLTAYHLLRVEVNGLQAELSLDEQQIFWQGAIPRQVRAIGLATEHAAAAFAGFALTEGWQDLFTGPDRDPQSSGWQAQSQKADWHIRQQELGYDSGAGLPSIIRKSALPGDYELVVNVRLLGESRAEAYGFLPALDGQQAGPLLSVARNGDDWVLQVDALKGSTNFTLASDFDPFHYQQFRFRKQGDRLTIHHEAGEVGQIKVPRTAAHIGLYASGNPVTFEMVRMTALVAMA
jgi:GH43 family beta-xylosidase